MSNPLQMYQNLISNNYKSLTSPLCVPFLGWHCPTIPPSPIYKAGLERITVAKDDLNFAFPLEFRQRQVTSQELHDSSALGACNIDFIFNALQHGGCCACRARLLRPIKEAFIRILWQLGDCGKDDGARIVVLESLDVKDLCSLYAGLSMVTKMFIHRDGVRRDHLEYKEEQELRHQKQEYDETLEWLQTWLTRDEREAMERRLTAEEGHINERTAVLRDIVLAHGPWLVLDLFGAQPERRDGLLAEIKRNVLEVLRPWEEGIRSASIPDSVNKRFEDILMSKLEVVDRTAMRDEINVVVWKIMDGFKRAEQEGLRAAKSGGSVQGGAACPVPQVVARSLACGMAST